jgi:AcrR family transcriptional regulator
MVEVVMVRGDLDTRERIVRAALAVLDETEDVGRVTVRRIAKRAGVAVGAINYHFGSKDDLLNEAVAGEMERLAERWTGGFGRYERDPVEGLKATLKGIAAVVARYPRYARISVSHELLHGRLGTARLLLPALREALDPTHSELQLRVIALQLVAPMQVAFLRAAVFREFAGVELQDDRARDELIDALVNNLIPSREGIRP